MRKGDWLQTYSGRKFWPLDPRPEDIAIEDIAHALSLVCRFGGHCLRFYSVAEHSIYVSHHCGKADALAGLLHDGSEAYLLDMVRPVKRFMPDYRAAEERLQRVVYERFGLNPQAPPSIKQTDMALLLAERAQLMLPTDDVWSVDAEPLNVKISGFRPKVAEQLFLDRFEEVGGWLT
jgi:5'-nucleotidase